MGGEKPLARMLCQESNFFKRHTEWMFGEFLLPLLQFFTNTAFLNIIWIVVLAFITWKRIQQNFADSDLLDLTWNTCTHSLHQRSPPSTVLDQAIRNKGGHTNSLEVAAYYVEPALPQASTGTVSSQPADIVDSASIEIQWNQYIHIELK